MRRPMSTAHIEHEIFVFDFDGTITTRDTFALFLRYYVGPFRWLINIFRLLPTFAAYKLGKIDRHAVEKAVIHRFFAGKLASDVESRAAQFAQDVIPGLIRPAAQDRIDALLADPNLDPSHYIYAALQSVHICEAGEIHVAFIYQTSWPPSWQSTKAESLVT